MVCNYGLPASIHALQREGSSTGELPLFDVAIQILRTVVPNLEIEPENN